MSIRLWPSQERPREKLLLHGSENLSDSELLAIFLRTGIRGQSAVDLARGLLNQFGSLRQIIEADQQHFCQQDGLGAAKYAQLQACVEMSRRYLRETLQRESALSNSLETKNYLISRLRHQTNEIFACLFLDNQHRVICYEELFHGTINSSVVYPREVIKRCLAHNAVAVIFAHNHPSGIAEPSHADRQLTQQLKKLLLSIDVHLLDHFVIGEGAITSFAESGIL